MLNGDHDMAEERTDNRIGDDLGVTQQVGDELPGSIRYGRNENDNMDDPSLAGGLERTRPARSIRPPDSRWAGQAWGSSQASTHRLARAIPILTSLSPMSTATRMRMSTA